MYLLKIKVQQFLKYLLIHLKVRINPLPGNLNNIFYIFQNKNNLEKGVALLYIFETV